MREIRLRRAQHRVKKQCILGRRYLAYRDGDAFKLSKWKARGTIPTAVLEFIRSIDLLQGSKIPIMQGTALYFEQQFIIEHLASHRKKTCCHSELVARSYEYATLP